MMNDLSSEISSDPLVDLMTAYMPTEPLLYVIKRNWLDRAPILSWLVERLAPALCVDVQPESGEFYFLTCQTVEKLGLMSRCYALLAEEDEGETVGAIRRHNARHYAAFSDIFEIPETKQPERFEASSIDLLHLGKCVDPEDQLRLWNDKLSSRALVIWRNGEQTPFPEDSAAPDIISGRRCIRLGGEEGWMAAAYMDDMPAPLANLFKFDATASELMRMCRLSTRLSVLHILHQNRPIEELPQSESENFVDEAPDPLVHVIERNSFLEAELEDLRERHRNGMTELTETCARLTTELKQLRDAHG